MRMEPTRGSFGDETGYEAFINHVHIEDLLPGATESEIFRGWLRFADRLARELERAFSHETFDIIVTASDSYIVRFHNVRDGHKSWLADDLELHGDEGVMIVRVPRRR